MRKYTFNIILFTLIGVFTLTGAASAYWIWTPETKKFINPKSAVKDSPKEQFEWAMSLYDAKDFQKAATEFEKLAKQYEFSEYASKSQYYIGLCYENMQKYYIAFQNYQKALDNFPHTANTEEILAREYAIGNIYMEKSNPKVLGTDIMAPLDRAVEIFRKVVENAPYGKYAEDAQYKLGEALKKSERYEEAVQEFHKLATDYPKSKHATKAMYEEAACAYKASLKPAYDASATDNAMKTFKKFVDKNKDTELAKEADSTMKRLKDNVAEKSFKAAEFYQSQGKREAAIIYYQDVIDTYPDSSFAGQAKTKIEALKARENKKKQKPIEQEPAKKPWSPFNFTSRKPESKEAAETAIQEAPKKKAWSPLNFTSRKPESKEAMPTAAQEPAKKKAWKPFNFTSRKPEVKEAAETAIQKPAKTTWNLLGFMKTKPPIKEKVETSPTPAVETPAPPPAPAPAVEAPVPASSPVAQVEETRKVEKAVLPIQEAPEKKGWQPLNFEGEEEEIYVEEMPEEEKWKPLEFFKKKPDSKESTDAAAPKKTWKPLNFEGKIKEGAINKTPKKKTWKPLNFGTREESAMKP